MHISRLLAGLTLVAACAPAETPGPDTSLDELTATIVPAGNGTGTITSTPRGIRLRHRLQRGLPRRDHAHAACRRRQRLDVRRLVGRAVQRHR